MKRVAFRSLWVAVLVECGYVAYSRIVLHAGWDHLRQPLIFVGLFGLFAASQGNIRWITVLPRLAIAAEFLLSVADRFGWLGPPGHGVSWGDFGHFVAYTRQVNAFLPASFAPWLAVLATVCEATLGITLLLGIRVQLFSRGAAVLLLLFAGAMTLSGLNESQFFYAVFVLSAGAWAISTATVFSLSLDNLIHHHQPQPA